jgi:hypothetical protein
MRRPVDADRIHAFMVALAASVTGVHTVYLVGGATAVLEGWRSSTIDIDIALPPGADADDLLRALPAIKDELELNVELASPADFVPVPAGWAERARSVGRQGDVTFLHYDPYAQALAKLERGHDRDLEDVGELLRRGLVDRERLAACFDEIEPELYRFPAIDPASFRRRVENAVGG